jgi:hypothetical protein
MMANLSADKVFFPVKVTFFHLSFIKISPNLFLLLVFYFTFGQSKME